MTAFKKCSLCEDPNGIEVSPDGAKYGINICKPCARQVAKAWAQCAGPVWVVITRKQLENRKVDRAFSEEGKGVE